MNDKLDYLINFLLNEMPEHKDDAKLIHDKKILFRSLMNIRPPIKLDDEFLRVQDEYLSHERDEKGVVDVDSIPETLPHISLWQGDITRLKCDAIVNAANSQLLGCFIPCHKCIDNAIHSASGLQLRDECNTIMNEQGHPEPVGHAKLTGAYNLPCKHVIHTVGPYVGGKLTDEHCDLLHDCYLSCLELAESHNLKSIAFCCISTGEFHFPNDIAAHIAADTVIEFMKSSHSLKRIIFNVFKDTDRKIYEEELRKYD